jgi:phage protein D
MPELVSSVYLKIGNQMADKKIMDDLSSIEVDQSLLLPDTFSVRLNDNFDGSQFEYTDGSTFAIGKAVEISAYAEGQEEKGDLIKGEITAIDIEYPLDGGTIILVRGYNKAHRLQRGRKNDTFLQQTDSDIVKKIASQCGLQADVDATSYKHEHVIQHNQTDMEFLQDRARCNGYFMYIKDNKLYFKKPDGVGNTQNQPVLKRGENLMEFQVRMTTGEQVNKGVVHDWDENTKKAIQEEVTSPSSRLKADIGLDKWGGDAAKAAFNKEASEVVDDLPVGTPDEAKAIAQSVIDERFSAFLQAEGTCDGNPAVSPGTKVKIENVGTRFSGSYLITRAVHRYDQEKGYITRFEISGHRANTLGQLLTSNGNGGGRHGVVIGKVTNLNDPDKLGRVKVQYPAIFAKTGSDGVESGWARLVTPMAGPERGIEFIPEINDEVLVAFEHDDINYPFILGSLWSKVDKPPLISEAVGDKTVNKRIIKSRSGHTIILDDTDNEEKISIVDKTAKNSVEINSKDNAITINSEADITIEGKANLTLKGKTILIEAIQGGNINVKGNNVSMEAQAKATVKGTSGADIEGAQVNVKGSAKTSIEGATTSVSGSAMTEIKGGVVKIN